MIANKSFVLLLCRFIDLSSMTAEVNVVLTNVFKRNFIFEIFRFVLLLLFFFFSWILFLFFRCDSFHKLAYLTLGIYFTVFILLILSISFCSFTLLCIAKAFFKLLCCEISLFLFYLKCRLFLFYYHCANKYYCLPNGKKKTKQKNTEQIAKTYKHKNETKAI